jgi:putative transposase
MDEYQSLSHTAWECEYHVVFIPKCRRKTLYGQLRQYLRKVFRRLAEQKGSRIEERHLMPDQVHMMISIPPKYAVSQAVGYIKGKSVIHLARVYGERKRNFVGQHFCARGYFVSMVGRDEAVTRAHRRNQEQFLRCWSNGCAGPGRRCVFGCRSLVLSDESVALAWRARSTLLFAAAGRAAPPYGRSATRGPEPPCGQRVERLSH